MMPFGTSSSSQANKRRCKEGDWVCLRCNNYNYAFREICNRCRYQTKIINEHALSLIGKENYGENSFPSALFIVLEEPKHKEKQIPFSSKSVLKQMKGKKLTEDNIVLNKLWINSLINE